MRLSISPRVIVLAVAGLAACHDSTTGSRAGASLRFSGAADLSDTIQATLPQELLVEMRDETGALAPAGTAVLFAAVPLSGQFPAVEATIEPPTSTVFGTNVTGATDAAGTAGVFVRLGTKAGQARIVVTVPTLGLEDTVRITVKPGNAIGMRVTPVDTSLYIGKSYTLRGGVADRWLNPRADPVTWSSSGAGVTVTSAGVVTATAVGQYEIKAVGVVAGVSGSAKGSVSVVPAGRLVATARPDNAPGVAIVAFDADGSNKTTLATGLTDLGIGGTGAPGVHPAWIPGTSTVIYAAAMGNYQKLFIVGADGVPKLFFGTTPANVTHQGEPTPTADGKWLFFSVFDTQCSFSDYCVARSRIDGSGYELLLTVPSMQPAPSPDGSKVAYMTPNVRDINAQTIRVLDVATKTSSTWSVAGSMPAWSPDGTRIAYRTIDGAVSIVTPDGSVQTVPGTDFVLSVSSWWPDGKWVLVDKLNGPALLDPATGATLRLGYAFTAGMGPTSVK